MKADLSLEPAPWMRDDKTQKIMALLNEGCDAAQALFVGGCVRNWFLNKAVHDIDIATILTPDVVMLKLSAADVKVIPTGIDHGTVTAVVDGQPFEITTLRHDVQTDGRHAKVCFTQSWLEDAKRRDFTMNTLLADNEGRVYDPLGCGIEDAKAGCVIFVGDARARIAEDYLRILRFFRFYAYYGDGAMDDGALGACRDAADKISTLSRERIMQEFLKILSISDPTNVLRIMFDNNILKNLADKNYQENVLQKLCVRQQQNDATNIEARLFVLAGCQPKLFEEHMRLSHAQKNFIIKLQMASYAQLYADERALKKAIYYHGNDLMVQGYFLGVAMGQVEQSAQMIDFAQNWQAPKCPVTGATLMAEGYVTGPDLGQELKRREEEWLEGVV